MCIVGTRGLDEDSDGTIRSDGVVRVSSASLTNLGVPVCYVPLSHTNVLLVRGIADINDNGHPSYIAIKSFLSGEIPASNVEDVEHLNEGALTLRLINPSGEDVSVRSFIGLFPKVFWTPRPPLELSRANRHTGYYYAAGANAGTYDLAVLPEAGYQAVTISDLQIRARQTEIRTVTVSPASASSTNEVASGDIDPVVFGNTNVIIDFSSGPGGSITVYRANDGPPVTNFSAVPHYWDIVSTLENSFAAKLIWVRLLFMDS